MAATINFAEYGEIGNGSRGSSASESTSKTSSVGSSSSGSFADQLTDQFLTCSLCSQFLRQPKILSCQHTFCAECIESHYDMDESDRPYRFLLSYNRDISCPVCRARTPVPTGGIRRLPDNFVVANLADVITRRKPSVCAGSMSRSSSAQFPPADTCDICIARSRLSGSTMTSSSTSFGRTMEAKTAAATVKCLDCVKLLCTDCAVLHKRTKVTSGHVLYSVSVEQEIECKIHHNETLRYYCEQCETCICVLCAFDGHSEHPVTSLIEGVQLQRAGFESMIGDCQRRIEVVRDQLRLIDGCRDGIQRAEGQIRDAAIEAIATVRRREAQLMSDLRRAVGEETFAFVADSKSFENQLEELVSASDVAEKLIGVGSSVSSGVEMLMNQRNIRDRLMSALDIQLRHTPEGLRRTIQLLPTECFYAEIKKSELFQLANNYGAESDDDEEDDVEKTDSAVQADEGIAKTSTADGETWTGDELLQNFATVGCQVSGPDDLIVVRPIIVAPSIEYVHLLPPATFRNRTSDDVTSTAPTALNPVLPTRRGSIQGRWPLEKSNSLTQDTAIQRQPTVWSYTLPKAATIEMVDSCVGSDHVETSDAGTLTAGPITADKETSTPHVIVVHKNVSTENQTMVDKSTTTAISDVTSAYRSNLQTTTSRRAITVSRGTSTSNPMTSDRATSPVRAWAPAAPFSVTSSSFAVARPPAQQQLQQPTAMVMTESPSQPLSVASGNGQIMIRTNQQAMTSTFSPRPTRIASTTTGLSPSVARLSLVMASPNQVTSISPNPANPSQSQPNNIQFIGRSNTSGSAITASTWMADSFGKMGR